MKKLVAVLSKQPSKGKDSKDGVEVFEKVTSSSDRPSPTAVVVHPRHSLAAKTPPARAPQHLAQPVGVLDDDESFVPSPSGRNRQGEAWAPSSWQSAASTGGPVGAAAVPASSSLSLPNSPTRPAYQPPPSPQQQPTFQQRPESLHSSAKPDAPPKESRGLFGKVLSLGRQKDPSVGGGGGAVPASPKSKRPDNNTTIMQLGSDAPGGAQVGWLEGFSHGPSGLKGSASTTTAVSITRVRQGNMSTGSSSDRPSPDQASAFHFQTAPDAVLSSGSLRAKAYSSSTAVRTFT